MSAGALLTDGLAAGRIQQRLRGNRMAYTGLPEPPGSGLQYATVTSLSPPVGGFSIITGQSPAVSLGDVLGISTTTTPGGYAVQLNGDGTYEVFSGGDQSRQSVTYEIFYHGSNTLVTGGTAYTNEVPPIWASAVLLRAQQLGAPLLVNLAAPGYATSTEGDTLSFALVSGSLPPGIALTAAGVLSGAYTASGSFSFVISATDSTGSSTNSPSCLIGVNVSPNSILAPDGIRVARHRRVLGRRIAPPGERPKDWQSLTQKEIEKQRRISRKLRLKREGREEEPEHLEEESALEEPAAIPSPYLPPPPGDHSALRASLLSGRHADDDRRVMAMHEQLQDEHHRAFHALAAYALRELSRL